MNHLYKNKKNYSLDKKLSYLFHLQRLQKQFKERLTKIVKKGKILNQDYLKVAKETIPRKQTLRKRGPV